jgi:glutathione synthase/RimK-type ligase-like ATP-grasp enzyme
LDAFTTRSWRRRRTTSLARFDLAMLVNPAEKLPPSNKTALNNFINARRQLGIAVDTIQHKDFGRLAEYDGLFIRETTQVDHPTYRFAKKAESEGMVVIDDPASILRCTNKIFLADLLRANQVPMPRYKLLSRDVSEPPGNQIGDLSYPVVVKIPDGSFSRGVVKAADAENLRRECQELFKRSSVLLAQEYVYTDYDWRVGILNRTPIFAARYFMSKGHWQIYKHGAGGRVSSGESETLLVEQAPAEVIQCATRAAALIGDGFYGVDLKQDGARTMVIEINDNPSIDAGYEDAALGKELYRIVMQEFLRRLQQRVSRSDRPATGKSQTAG